MIGYLKRRGYMVHWYSWEQQQQQEAWAVEADNNVLQARISYCICSASDK